MIRIDWHGKMSTVCRIYWQWLDLDLDLDIQWDASIIIIVVVVGTILRSKSHRRSQSVTKRFYQIKHTRTHTQKYHPKIRGENENHSSFSFFLNGVHCVTSSSFFLSLSLFLTHIHAFFFSLFAFSPTVFHTIGYDTIRYDAMRCDTIWFKSPVIPSIPSILHNNNNNNNNAYYYFHCYYNNISSRRLFCTQWTLSTTESSVVMTAVTARATGGPTVVVFSPKPTPILPWQRHMSLVLITCCGVGVAQAIATIAYGVTIAGETDTMIPPCVMWFVDQAINGWPRRNPSSQENVGMIYERVHPRSSSVVMTVPLWRWSLRI